MRTLTPLTLPPMCRIARRTLPRLTILSVVAAWSLVGSIQAADPPDVAGLELFEKKIRPVLVANCYECHSSQAAAAKKLQGGLRLDVREAMRTGGDSGPAVVPGNVKRSLLIAAIRHEDLEMPPKKKLPDEVIADFVRWIDLGAPDPRDDDPAALPGPVDFAEARKFWAFQPVKLPAVPEVKNSDWPTSDLDRFVLAKLEAAGISPVAAANKRELLRRATFDLTGLPPTPAEVDAFLADDSRQAFAKVVDRLLQSPHYGERWARHWLDVARYAEDQAHTFGVKAYTEAYRYRDWVVSAFNSDMPYDRFVRLQVAGDLLPEDHGDPVERLAGLGFFGLGVQYYKDSGSKKVIADELDDRIDTLTRGFLALTVSCARCHDHKFDPIPSGDYYSLAGIFNGSQLTEAPIVSAETVREYDAAQEQIKQHDARVADYLLRRALDRNRAVAARTAEYLTAVWIVQALQAAPANVPIDELAKRRQLDPAALKQWLSALDPRKSNTAPPELAQWFKLELTGAITGGEDADWTSVTPPAEVETLAADYQSRLLAALDAYDQAEGQYQHQLAQAPHADRGQVKRPELSKESDGLLRAFFFADRAPLGMPRDAMRKVLTGEKDAELARQDAELERLKLSAPPKYPTAHILRGGGQTMQVYLRGDPERLGDVAPRGFLQVLGGEPPPSDPEEAQHREFTRLDLANAIASRANPLTARVIVNRVWQHHFGRGLVGTASNFGHLGDRPTHPELLDFLAAKLIESGWSLKELHRTIMLSSTYRLASRDDQANSQIDADNRLLWRANRRRLDVESWRDALLAVAGTLDPALGGPTVDPADPANRRRTLYAKISRHNPNGLLVLFDFPDANVTASERPVTTVPQQQLFVLNSPLVIRQAEALAARIEKGADNVDERITLAYRLAYGREPSDQEQEIGRKFLAAASAPPPAGQPQDKLSPWAQYAQAILASNEFLYVD